MAHKYNKITKEQALEVFKSGKKVNRVDVCKAYNCSVYSTRIALEDLLDDGVIKLVHRGYRRV